MILFDYLSLVTEQEWWMILSTKKQIVRNYKVAQGNFRKYMLAIPGKNMNAIEKLKWDKG